MCEATLSIHAPIPDLDGRDVDRAESFLSYIGELRPWCGESDRFKAASFAVNLSCIVSTHILSSASQHSKLERSSSLWPTIRSRSASIRIKSALASFASRIKPMSLPIGEGEFERKPGRVYLSAISYENPVGKISHRDLIQRKV